jgi:Peptidase family S41
MHKSFFILFLYCILFCIPTFAQVALNFDFEDLDPLTGIPKGVHFDADQQKTYPLSVDSFIRQHGSYSVILQQKDSNAQFGLFSFSIKPNFSGKKLTLKGYIRTENVSGGFAGLWIRVDGIGGTISFDNMANKGVTGSTDWKEYQVEVDFDEEEANLILVGGLLVGKGKIWLDNFQLLVDDKDIALAPAKKEIKQKARLDTAFLDGSNVVIGKLNKTKIGNLANLGMIWGFLKYYHPAIGEGQFNWDAELFRILPKVLAAYSKSEFNSVVEKWVDGLGKPDSCKGCNNSLKLDSDIKLIPDYGRIFQNNNLEKTLIAKLENIRNNRHQGKGYYIDEVAEVGNPVFRNENAYSRMLYPDAGYRLLALFRYWNMIQYFYPYKHLIGEDWNQVLPQFIPKFLDARDSVQYVLTCLELIARIHDTHANVWGSNNILDNYLGKYHALIQAKIIMGELVVTGYYFDTLGIKDEIKIGDVIEKINGQIVEELINKNLYLTPASNYETQLRDLPYRILLRGLTDRLKLQISRDGKTFPIEIKTFPAARLNNKLDYDPNPGDSSYKIINSNIGYVFPGKYKNSQLEGIEKAFAGTKGMIIDMRTYPSDFMPFTFGSYIKTKPSPFVKFTSGDLNLPGLFGFGPLLNNGIENSASYKGPIVIIVNATTQSQAEYTTMAFQSAPNITVIGSTTAGADGNVSMISLPGRVSTMISGIGVYYPDGTETQRKGVKIDIVIHPTIKGIKEGKDELLEKAIEIINISIGSSQNK